MNLASAAHVTLKRARARRGSPVQVVDAVLPGPYQTPPAVDGIRPSAATRALVQSQVDALLHASPAFLGLDESSRRALRQDLAHVASYSAELVRDDFYQALRLGQRPVLISPKAAAKPLTRAQAFTPDAASNIGRVTRDTLQAISFPTFVADLIRSTFTAIVNASIQQMEAYGKLLANVAKTVDEFMSDNISDNQARDWLAQTYPDHIQVRRTGQTAAAVAREGGDDRPAPNFHGELGIGSDVSMDEDSIESTLVPAARRKLAQTRHQMLATMVLMGMQRIVITSGTIKAKMGFHIDTSDILQQQHASDFDLRVAAAGSFGFGPWSASLSTSVAYVTSDRSQQQNEMNVSADLTSEVELKFKSDYIPLERFVNQQGIQHIQGATAVPEANAPPNADGSPAAARSAAAPAEEGATPARPRHRLPDLSAMQPLRAVGQLPAAPAAPTAPTAPVVTRRVDPAHPSPTTPPGDSTATTPASATPATPAVDSPTESGETPSVATPATPPVAP
jgi:hypothetical protein